MWAKHGYQWGFVATMTMQVAPNVRRLQFGVPSIDISHAAQAVALANVTLQSLRNLTSLDAMGSVPLRSCVASRQLQQLRVVATPLAPSAPAHRLQCKVNSQYL